MTAEKMAAPGATTTTPIEQGEKRVFSRVECLLDLELKDQQVDPLGVEAIEACDLSILGLGFQRSAQDRPLPLGRRVTVGIHGFPPVQAQVRWNRGSRVGVQFCGRLQDIIESWVGEVLAAQGVRVQDLFEVSRL
jgi:hypothetical protein